MALINVMEQVVEDRLMQMLEGENCCKCEQCLEDMKAKALNLLPAKYVSTKKGELFSKLEAVSRQNTASLNVAITSAISCIAANPSHPPKDDTQNE